MPLFHHSCTLWQSSHPQLSVESDRVSLVRYVFATCGDWDLKTILPSQCVTSKEEVPMAFRRWLNVKMPGTALGSSRVQDGHIGMSGKYLFDPFWSFLCTLHIVRFMFVGSFPLVFVWILWTWYILNLLQVSSSIIDHPEANMLR